MKFFAAALQRVSDYVFKISTLQIFLGLLMLLSLMGRFISNKGQEFKQYTEQPVLTERLSYSPASIREYFAFLGEEGKKKSIFIKRLLIFTLPY